MAKKTIRAANFSHHANHAPAATKLPELRVVEDLELTLEWLLESPPNVHQFDEPPVSRLSG